MPYIYSMQRIQVLQYRYVHIYTIIIVILILHVSGHQCIYFALKCINAIEISALHDIAILTCISIID